MTEKNWKSHKKEMKKYHLTFEASKYRDSFKDVIVSSWTTVNMFTYAKYSVCERKEMCNTF